jgi:hypothetical protein
MALQAPDASRRRPVGNRRSVTRLRRLGLQNMKPREIRFEILYRRCRRSRRLCWRETRRGRGRGHLQRALAKPRSDSQPRHAVDPQGVCLDGIPAERIVGCVVYPAAELVAPGVVRHIDGAEQVGRHKTSMLQDLEAGHAMEIDALLGSVVELGALSGVPTPTMRAIYEASKLLAHTIETEKVAVRGIAIPQV